MKGKNRIIPGQLEQGRKIRAAAAMLGTPREHHAKTLGRRVLVVEKRIAVELGPGHQGARNGRCSAAKLGVHMPR